VSSREGSVIRETNVKTIIASKTIRGIAVGPSINLVITIEIPKQPSTIIATRLLDLMHPPEIDPAVGVRHQSARPDLLPLHTIRSDLGQASVLSVALTIKAPKALPKSTMRLKIYRNQKL